MDRRASEYVQTIMRTIQQEHCIPGGRFQELQLELRLGFKEGWNINTKGLEYQALAIHQK